MRVASCAARTTRARRSTRWRSNWRMRDSGGRAPVAEGAAVGAAAVRLDDRRSLVRLAVGVEQTPASRATGSGSTSAMRSRSGVRDDRVAGAEAEPGYVAQAREVAAPAAELAAAKASSTPANVASPSPRTVMSMSRMVVRSSAGRRRRTSGCRVRRGWSTLPGLQVLDARRGCRFRCATRGSSRTGGSPARARGCAPAGRGTSPAAGTRSAAAAVRHRRPARAR